MLSCSSAKNEKITCDNSLQNKEIAFNSNVDIDASENNYSLSFTSGWSNDSISYLVSIAENKVQIFDLTNQKHVYTYDLFGGPNSLYITDFYVHSSDSLFLYSHEDYRMYLVDFEGNIKRKYRLNTVKAGELHAQYHLEGLESIRCRISFDAKNNLIYMPVVPAGSYQEPEFYEQKFLMVYDLAKEDFLEVVGKFPEEYGSELMNPVTPDGYSIIPNDRSSFYINFFQSPYVYLYNWEDDIFLERYCIKSNLFNGQFLTFEGDIYNVHDMVQYIITTNRFGPLLKLDEGFALYFKNEQSHQNADGTAREVFDSEWSLIALDDQFALIDEQVFKGGKYWFYNTFSDGNHIYVSEDNVYHNENDDEDLLQFDVFEIN